MFRNERTKSRRNKNCIVGLWCCLFLSTRDFLWYFVYFNVPIELWFFQKHDMQCECHCFAFRRLTNGVDRENYYPRTFQSATMVCSDFLTPTLFNVQSTPAEAVRCVNHVYGVVMQTIAKSPLTKFTQLLDTVIVSLLNTAASVFF